MELYPDYISRSNSGYEFSAVWSGGNDMVIVFRNEVIAVYEIKIGTVGDAIEQRRLSRGVNLVPPDVRNLFRVAVWLKAPDLAGQETKTGDISPFMTPIGQQLHPETNPQQWDPFLL